MLYCPNFFWNVLQVWMTGKDVYLQMTWSWPDKTWNILCSYCLQWNTSQSKFRNHYFLFLFAFFHTVPTFSDLGLYIKESQIFMQPLNYKACACLMPKIVVIESFTFSGFDRCWIGLWSETSGGTVRRYEHIIYTIKSFFLSDARGIIFGSSKHLWRTMFTPSVKNI